MQIVGDDDSRKLLTLKWPSPDFNIRLDDTYRRRCVADATRVAIDRGHMVTPRREEKCVPTVAASDIEQPSVGRNQRGEAHHP